MVGHTQTRGQGQTQERAEDVLRHAPTAPAHGEPRVRGLLARGVPVGALLVGMVLAGVACGVSDEGSLPPDLQDPATLKTPAGALARYRGAVAALGGAFDGAMVTGGLLTDELVAPLPLGSSGPYTFLDSRQSSSTFSPFSPARLHLLRGEAREARGFLAAFAPDASPALQGHLYALEGYAEILLADLFCSGIPLSTVDFDGNYTLAPGSSTTEVYRHALELFDSADVRFDSAQALGSDSVQHFRHLAAVGRGRARLALGQYADAATAAAAVLDDAYTYRTPFTFSLDGGGTADSATLWWYATRFTPGAATMADQEGGTGLPYLSSADPRTSATAVGSSQVPAKYGASSPVTFTVASGAEARLIEAEAALQADDPGTWLAKLNQPRQTACATIMPPPPSGCPLAPLEDPGAVLTDPAAAKAARVDLLFRERAFWLYLTAHRQGDLRRLIRPPYSRSPNSVYPTGFSYPGGRGDYGNAVVVPMPEDERRLNPLYTGCINQNA